MKLKGSGLVEYAVPLALVGITVGIGLYYLTSNGNLLNIFLGSSNSKYSTSTKTATLNKKDNVTATVFSQNPTVPDPVIHFSGTVKPPEATSSCVSGTCTIDFGDYVLKGVPANIAETVRSNGTSGGMDTLYNLIMQIADQLQQEGDLAGAQDYRDLANLGHFMAMADRGRETVAQQCKATNTSLFSLKNCLTNNMVNIPRDPSLQNIVDIVSASSNQLQTYNIGYARYLKINDPSAYLMDLHSRPGYLFVDIYDRINQDPKYSAQLKGITTQLYLTANNLQNVTDSSYEAIILGDTVTPYPVSEYDPFSGAKISKDISFPSDLLGLITTPQISTDQNFNSALICAAGNNKDVNNKCNK